MKMFAKTLLFFTFAHTALISLEANPVSEQDIGWNELIYVEGLFTPEINTIPIRSGEKSVIISHLNAILEQDDILNQIYNRYLQTFDKENPSNYEKSKKQFASALVRVVTHNLEANKGEHSWWRGINQFSDISEEEMRSRIGFKSPHENIRTSGNNPPVYPGTENLLDTLPSSYDWRTSGKVTPVKDQKMCQSCTQFACTAQLETIWAHFNNVSAVSLSPQETMDCSEPGVDHCRNGVWPEVTYKYLMSTGVTTWDEYPYTGVYGRCQGAQKSHSHFAKDHFDVFSNTEDDIKKGVVGWGPIYISINVSQSLQDYRNKGIFSGDCGAQLGTHSVAVIGYGTEGNTDYWLIKNSWGSHWGYDGYLKMRRGVNMCGITTHPRIVTVPIKKRNE